MRFGREFFSRYACHCFTTCAAHTFRLHHHRHHHRRCRLGRLGRRRLTANNVTIVFWFRARHSCALAGGDEMQQFIINTVIEAHSAFGLYGPGGKTRSRSRAEPYTSRHVLDPADVARGIQQYKSPKVIMIIGDPLKYVF